MENTVMEKYSFCWEQKLRESCPHKTARNTSTLYYTYYHTDTMLTRHGNFLWQTRLLISMLASTAEWLSLAAAAMVVDSLAVCKRSFVWWWVICCVSLWETFYLQKLEYAHVTCYTLLHPLLLPCQWRQRCPPYFVRLARIKRSAFPGPSPNPNRSPIALANPFFWPTS